MQKRLRGKQINLRVSEKEAKRFARVARHHKLGVSALIRMLVKKEALAIKTSSKDLSRKER